MRLSDLLFGRSGGYYLFWASAVYLVIGFANIAFHFTEVEYIQCIWLLVLALPFAVPPFGRYFNLDVTWDQKMFNMFKKKEATNNVVPFPKQETE